MTTTEVRPIEARVVRVSADTPGEFQTFDITVDIGQMAQFQTWTVGTAQFSLYHPTDEDLRRIVAACQSELERRKNGNAVL